MLNDSVLVLNRNWVAIHICNVRRALVLLYQDLARVVSEDFELHDFQSWRDLSQVAESQLINTPNFRIKAPEVIVLNYFNKTPPRYIKFSRRNIYLRDKNTCQYCGNKIKKEELTIDHIVPRSRGGKSAWDNVVLACMNCNSRKGDKLLSECGMKLISQPKRPYWLSSFRLRNSNDNNSLWQKFVDNAYWDVILDE